MGLRDIYCNEAWAWIVMNQLDLFGIFNFEAGVRRIESTPNLDAIHSKFFNFLHNGACYGRGIRKDTLVFNYTDEIYNELPWSFRLIAKVNIVGQDLTLDKAEAFIGVHKDIGGIIRLLNMETGGRKLDLKVDIKQLINNPLSDEISNHESRDSLQPK